ncbi:MAG: C69 family dipeptidase, partial [Methylococcales bacterium]|nr:C69 family dipeptidase [Methylococcales bacterium]
QARGVNDGWGFGVLIADAQEAWYLETLSGHQWVAVRIPDNKYFVAANGAGQIQGYEPDKYSYLLSSYKGINPITFATNSNFAHFENEIFNFRASYGDVQRATNRNSNYVRMAYAQHFFNPSTQPFNQSVLNQNAFPMLLTPEHPITIEELKTLQASHYQDFPEFDPYLSSVKEESDRPFYYPIANLRTSNAHITEIAAELIDHDYAISNLEYIALGMPTISFYLPIYYGLTTIPSQLKGANHKADNRSLFWQFRKLQTLVFWSDPDKHIPFEFITRQAYIYKHYEALYKVIAAKQAQLEQKYAALKDPKLIDTFTQETVDAVSQLNQQLIDYFMHDLDIENQYHLTTTHEQNQWFTRAARQQDCFYRRYRCDPEFNMSLSRRDKYV